MSKLIGGSKIYGSLTANGSIIAPCGTGFQNIVALTSGSSYTLPSQLTAGAKFKLTIIGGGGGGGGHTTSTNSTTSGGGSGGVLVVILTYVVGVGSFSYGIGGGGTGGTGANASAGGSSTVTYNSITYTAGGGGGGFSAPSLIPTVATGGTNSCTTPALIAMANGLTNCLNISGFPGKRGSDGQIFRRGASFGGNTPLDWGQGGVLLGQNDTSNRNGVDGTGYGSGGSGSHTSQTVSTGTGGAGAPGIIVLEY